MSIPEVAGARVGKCTSSRYAPGIKLSARKVILNLFADTPKNHPIMGMGLSDTGLS
jgi:hypothetical protein